MPEQIEPTVQLARMATGGEVVEDYCRVGLTLRSHPVSFLRADLARRGIVTCAEAAAGRDGRRIETAGLVLVRQRPGSARGVMFITLEDETGIANLVVWPKVFEAYRGVILNAGMIGVRGRIQREGEVVHVVARHLVDLTDDLAGIGQRDGPSPLPPPGRGSGLRHHDAAASGAAEAIRIRSRDFR